jgi:hypothetical protein
MGCIANVLFCMPNGSNLFALPMQLRLGIFVAYRPAASELLHACTPGGVLVMLPAF